MKREIRKGENRKEGDYRVTKPKARCEVEQVLTRGTEMFRLPYFVDYAANVRFPAKYGETLAVLHAVSLYFSSVQRASSYPQRAQVSVAEG